MKSLDADRVRWNIFVPKDIDIALRTHLCKAGLKKDLSKFVADAVHWRLFDINVSAAQADNAHAPSGDIENAIEQAVSEVRSNRAIKHS
jgi:hypothetical protein